MQYWELAQNVKLQVSHEIVGGFSMGFDRKLSEQTRHKLIDFAYWVEDRYPMPVTLWVDFKDNCYLLDENRKRVGYKFYCVEFKDYPVFEKEADIPVIELPVRRPMEELLPDFIEALSRYFAWLVNKPYEKDEAADQQLLQTWLKESCAWSLSG